MKSKKCKYCKGIFYKVDFPKCFNRMITCGSSECIRKHKKEWTYSKHCPDCGKPITHLANKCHSCVSKGENNPFYGKTHSKETKKKLKLFYKGMTSLRKGVKLSEEQIEKTAFKLRGRKPSKEIIKKRLKRRTPSSLEKKMIDIIFRYNLPYKFVGDGKFFIEKKNPDFINVNGEKIAIEVFYRKHKEVFSGGLLNWMENRRKIFNKYNWKLLFFNEIQVNDDEVRGRLK